MQSSPAREEGEVPESELDPDTRRRLLILQHGQDVREPPPPEPFAARPPAQVSMPRIASRGNWFNPVEEEMSPRQLSRAGPKGYALDSEMHVEKHRSHPPPPFPNIEKSALPERIFHENQRLPKEVNTSFSEFTLPAESLKFICEVRRLLLYRRFFSFPLHRYMVEMNG